MNQPRQAKVATSLLAQAANRAKPTPYPNAWRVRELVLAVLPLGTIKLIYVTCVVALGWFGLKIDEKHSVR